MDRSKVSNAAIGSAIVAGAATVAGIASLLALREYRRQYSRGRIVSLRDCIASHPARRRMRRVLRTMLPLWKSRYGDDVVVSARSPSSSGGPPEPIPIRFRASDVVVFAPPKSGTTWITHICHTIRTRGADVDFDDQDDVVPWIERLGTEYLAGTRFNDRPDADHVAMPRVFKSHLTWEEMPEGPYRRIWVFRDVVDAMVSAAHFLPSLWGIDPPPSEEEMCSFLLGAGDAESALTSLVSAWDYHRRRDDDADDAMLLLFYENVADDHAGTVERIAEFMNVDLSREELDRVVSQTTKGGMLRHHAAFACRAQARNAHRARGLVLDESKLVGKVRRRNDVRSDGRKDDVVAAVGRAWECIVARGTGFVDYESMRGAAKCT